MRGVGFYFELERTDPATFKEGAPAPVFWAFYAFGGFALACMAGAAFTLLRDLLREGSAFDVALVLCIALSVPAYVLIGLKLLGLRKFVCLQEGRLVLGYRFFEKPFWKKVLLRDEVGDITLVNHRPSPNLAAKHQDDPQYQIRGHWRVVAETRSGRSVVLDRHTEKGALIPLFKAARAWLGD